VGASLLYGVAVGAGSVWATALEEGLLWRIEPGPRPTTRTIDVGVGVTFVDFGEGAVWTGNYLDGAVTRVDPDSNAVVGKSSVGTPQALSVGAGAAWVSVAGGAEEGAVTASSCDSVASGGAAPDVLIASDLPLQGPDSATPRALEDAIRFVLDQRHFRAGEHTVGYQSCDDSTLETGGFELRKCAANASAYAQARQLVAVIGSWSSFCTQVQLSVVNRAPGGPVPMVSPTNTHSGLTVGGPVAEPAPSGLRGEPEIHYPTCERNFARVVAREDHSGAALAMLAKQLGLKRPYVLDDRSAEGRILMAGPFRRAARGLGLPIAGSHSYNDEARSFAPLAERVARSGADGVLLGGWVYGGANDVVKALRARLGPDLPIMVNDFMFVPVRDVLDLTGPAARGIYIASNDIGVARRHLPPAGRRFLSDFGASGNFGTPLSYVAQAAQATEVVLDAIERSDGTRASVLEELGQTNVEDGIIGSFRIDANGDITPAPIAILRITGATPPAERLPDVFDGAVVDRVLRVPARLAG
jgi:branched-chain amino acid transport system substrate-binding protein